MKNKHNLSSMYFPFSLNLDRNNSSSCSTQTKQQSSHHSTTDPQSLQSIRPTLKKGGQIVSHNHPPTPASTVAKASRPGTTVAGCKSAGKLDWSTRVIFTPSWGQLKIHAPWFYNCLLQTKGELRDYH